MIKMEITPDTTWFKVSKYSGMNPHSQGGRPYNLFYRTPDNMPPSQARIAGGFATKAEAVAEGERRGWIQVAAWYEAEAQAEPLLKTWRDNYHRERMRRNGKAHLVLAVPHSDGQVTRHELWLDPAAAVTLVESLGTPDEFGVIPTAEDVRANCEHTGVYGGGPREGLCATCGQRVFERGQ